MPRIIAMKAFQPFLLERMMSAHEQDVEFNLSESGVHPMTLKELAGTEISTLLETSLNYPVVNGEPELRRNIAGMYKGAARQNVLVTVGAIEANFLTVSTLLNDRGKIAVMSPNYLQIWGLAKNLGLAPADFYLDADKNWALDVDSLADAAKDADLVAVCNPNNPTGHVLRESEMDAIVAAAGSNGSWILADEVYSGAERLGGNPTPSFFGRYEKVIAVGSTSKAYGLPGLRLGWAVAPVELIERIWERHEYVAISASMLSNKLAALALSSPVRHRIIERTRGFISRGFAVLERWASENADLVSVSPPDAGAIALVRYRPDIGSVELADRLRQEKSVLVAPGAHFDAEGYVRISFGLPEDHLKEGLERIASFLKDLD